MQSEAYKISGFTLIVSALGFMLRWLQIMQIMDEETGLARPAAISWIVVLLIVAVAAVLVGFVFHLRQFIAPSELGEALVGRTAFFGAISLVPAVLLIIAGAAQIVQVDESTIWPTLHRLCGAATVVGGVGAVLIVTNVGKKEKADTCRTGSVMMILFAGFWLVTGYRDAATDPVTWRFVVEIITGCVMLLALYHTSGYLFGVPHPKWTLFFTHFGAFLCVMSSINEHTIGQSMTYAAMAILFLIWGFTVTENLKTRPFTPVMPGEEK